MILIIILNLPDPSLKGFDCNVRSKSFRPLLNIRPKSFEPLLNVRLKSRVSGCNARPMNLQSGDFSTDARPISLGSDT